MFTRCCTCPPSYTPPKGRVWLIRGVKVRWFFPQYFNNLLASGEGRNIGKNTFQNSQITERTLPCWFYRKSQTQETKLLIRRNKVVAVSPICKNSKKLPSFMIIVGMKQKIKYKHVCIRLFKYSTHTSQSKKHCPTQCPYYKFQEISHEKHTILISVQSEERICHNNLNFGPSCTSAFHWQFSKESA